MKLTVIGLGYLGVTHATAMAALGFEVIGVDTDADKVAILQGGAVPFHEPGLTEAVAAQMATGRLRFTTSYVDGCSGASVHFVCVGTPALEGGALDLEHVTAAFEGVARAADVDSLIVGKSTVPAGTANQLAFEVSSLNRSNLELEVAWNPEFLREGHALRDTLHPDRLVFGTHSSNATHLLNEVYAQVIESGVPVIQTDLTTAELIKVAANGFLATKISYINAISEVAETSGANVRDIAAALGADPRIGSEGLRPGLGFGGGCLPKDLGSFKEYATELQLTGFVGLLSAVQQINVNASERALKRVVRLAGEPTGDTHVAILGAAFKPNSDDIRDSPAIELAASARDAGYQVSITDPRALDNARAVLPEVNFQATLTDAVRGADVIILATEWDEYRTADPRDLGPLVRAKRLLDCRSVLPLNDWRRAGWVVEALGVPIEPSRRTHLYNHLLQAKSQLDATPTNAPA